MSAPLRVTNQEIRDALEASRGNVEAAARAVGIAPNNLRARLERLCIDVAAVRAAAPRMRSIRVPEDLHERLRGAKFDLAARLRTELDEAAVLDMFVTDAFEEWLGRRLGGPR